MVGQGSHGVQLQAHPQLPQVHQGLGAGHKLLEAHLSAVRPLGCMQTQEKQVPVIVPHGLGYVLNRVSACTLEKWLKIKSS